ncbi:NADP-dependent oxidoreductase domain-containing protein [Mycena galopus ATCC 62051]|nr:NADP-dependent oxidoreductase domain-containing protein [Mycena galopus ATCC 62051]
MHLSVEASLKKLRTTYIDILYVHWWDWETGVEEVMNGLHNLVVQGKVFTCLGHPSLVTPFVIYQGKWNVLDRSFEREIIPMARAHGGAMIKEHRRATGERGRTAFHPSGNGMKTKENFQSARKVAGEVGTKSITAVAIAYVMAKVPYCFPILGGRKVEHLIEQIAYLESVVPFDPGFPVDLISYHLAKQPLLEPIPHTNN